MKIAEIEAIALAVPFDEKIAAHNINGHHGHGSHQAAPASDRFFLIETELDIFPLGIVLVEGICLKHGNLLGIKKQGAGFVTCSSLVDRDRPK